MDRNVCLCVYSCIVYLKHGINKSIGRNCNAPSARQLYIQELMKYIPVDSYGKCLHNKDVPEGFPGRYNSSDLSYLSDLIKDYKVVS